MFRRALSVCLFHEISSNAPIGFPFVISDQSVSEKPKK